MKRRQVIEAIKNQPPTPGRDNLTAGQVMTPNPTCIRPGTNLLELIQLFHAKQFRHLLVADADHRLIGVLSDRDVLRCLGPSPRPKEAILSHVTAEQIMSSDVVTIERDAPVEQAVALMIAEGINCLPVLAEGQLIGILTNTDLNVVLQVLLETLPQSSSAEPASADVAATAV